MRAGCRGVKLRFFCRPPKRTVPRFPSETASERNRGTNLRIFSGRAFPPPLYLFYLITIFTPGLAHLMTIFMEAWGMATQPAVDFFEPVQCRKMQLPLPGVPSAL